MNKTGEYLKSRKDVLSVYFTAGYPNKESTNEIILALQESGADLIEIGIPFSDPLADGPIIQKSGEVALQNGFTLQNLFEDLKAIQPFLKIPLVLMGYFNTAFAFGIKSFLSHCKALKIDTVILPDLPVNIYAEKYMTLFAEYNVSPVFLITPQTPHDRILVISELSKAFIYIVSDNSITGSSNKFSETQLAYFERIKNIQFNVPALLGFGISNKATFNQACKYFNGAIIGSALIKKLETGLNIQKTIDDFVSTLRS